VHRAIAALLNEFCWRVDGCRGSESPSYSSRPGRSTAQIQPGGRDAIHSCSVRERIPVHAFRGIFGLTCEFVGRDDVYIAEAYSLTMWELRLPQRTAPNCRRHFDGRIVFENGQARFASRSLELAVEGRLVPEELLP